VHPRFEVEPPQTWYYHISLNSCTLMILLQVNPVFGDEFEIAFEGFYEIENISNFTWSSILGIAHYR
jgi:hypothetical protein